MGTEQYVREAAKKCGWFKYYLLERPVSIGTCPSKGMMDFINFERKTDFSGVLVWSEVYYDRLLSKEELDKYEMMKGD